MAYSKDELEKKALKEIRDKNLFFIEDVVSFLPCVRGTFYNKDLHKLDSIKEALENNKVKTKHHLRNRWYKSESATKQLALYKLLASQEEYFRLANSLHQIEHSGELEVTGIDLDPESIEETE